MDYGEFQNKIEESYALYFDTNSILELYRLPNSLVLNYIAAFDQLENNRVRISPRVVLELKKNKNNVKKQKKERLKNSISNLKKNINSLDASISEVIINIKYNNLRVEDTGIKELEQLSRDITEIFKGNFSDDTSYLLDSDKEEAEQIIEEHINRLFKKTNIIPEKNEREKINAIKEGYIRVHHNYPPGYMDLNEKYYKRIKQAPKNRESVESFSIERLTDYLGDYFIWSDILNDKHINKKLFITNDLKEDWWENPEKNKDRLTDYKPRKELIEEFKVVNPTQEISFIPFSLFLYYLTIYFEIEAYESYFIVYGEKLFNLDIEMKLRDSYMTHAEIESYILLNYDLSDGLSTNYHVDNLQIEIEDVFVTSLNLIGLEEITVDTNGNRIFEYTAECNLEVNGEWQATLVDNDVDFSVNYQGNYEALDVNSIVITQIEFTMEDIKNNDLKDIEDIIEINEHEVTDVITIDIFDLDLENNQY